MKTLWSELEAFDKLKHIFFISCDSHELQLLLDDILKLSWFVKILKNAQYYNSSYASLLIAMLMTILKAIIDCLLLEHRLVLKSILFRVNLCSSELYK